MPEQKQVVTVNSRKFDGKIHRSWQAELVERKNSQLVLIGKFETDINHSNLGFIRRGTISFEYYWLDRWYNIFIFYEPEGDLRNFYCNVNLPPKFENNILDYIDLDIDVLVWPNFGFEVLDCDEFERHAKNFGYSEDLILRVHQTTIEIQDLIRRREFPFS